MVGVVVLAAGYGVLDRFEGPSRPKLLARLHPDQPETVIERTVKVATQIGPTIVVINPLYGDLVRGALGSFPVEYVVQPDRHGTAKATELALPWLESQGADSFVVLFGDMPLWTVATVKELITEHDRTDASLTLVSVALQDDCPQVLQDYGHFSRDGRGFIEDVHEPTYHRARTFQQLIGDGLRWVNPSLMCFRIAWFHEHVGQIRPISKKDGYQPEFHLSRLIPLAAEQMGLREVVLIDPSEAVGLNNPSHLFLVRAIWRNRDPKT